MISRFWKISSANVKSEFLGNVVATVRKKSGSYTRTIEILKDVSTAKVNIFHVRVDEHKKAGWLMVHKSV